MATCVATATGTGTITAMVSTVIEIGTATEIAIKGDRTMVSMGMDMARTLTPVATSGRTATALTRAARSAMVAGGIRAWTMLISAAGRSSTLTAICVAAAPAETITDTTTIRMGSTTTATAPRAALTLRRAATFAPMATGSTQLARKKMADGGQRH